MYHRYQLISRLEERPLSELFIAQGVAGDADASDKRLVKLFLPRFSTPEFARALQVEASQRAAAIGCPQLLAYQEIGFLDGRLTAIRPYVDGYALDDVVRRLYSKEVVLTAPLALYLVAETARAVARAHAQGLAHGALDTSNLLLGFDGALRVSGFGMMRALGAADALKALAPKLHRAFRPPEQRDPCQATLAGDVYALGCVAYELLTLVSVAEVRGGGLSTKRDALMPPSRLNRRINARIDPIIMRALETMPSRRYQNAGQFAEALQSLFALLGTAVGPQELAHFAREVFPNEVSLTGGSAAAALPLAEPFALQPLGSGAGLPAPAPAAAEAEALPARAAPVMSEHPPALPPPRTADVTDAGELGVSEQQLFEAAFGEEAPPCAALGSAQQEGLRPQEEDGEVRHQRAEGEVQEAPVARAVIEVEARAKVLDAEVLPIQAEAASTPGAEATQSQPPQAQQLNPGAPSAAESGGADPLASWEAPAGPMPALIRRASLGEVRLNADTSASDTPASPRGDDALQPAEEGDSRGAEAAPAPRVMAPEAAFEGAPTAETPAVQVPIAPSPVAADGGAASKARQRAPRQARAGAWNAFASTPAKASRAAGSPRSQENRAEEEEDWRVRPQPLAMDETPRPRRWGRWAAAFVCALCLACLAVAALVEREPDTAKLSKEALQKLSAALEHRVAPAYLTVETNAPAMVIINGKRSPVDAPFEDMALPPGRHIVRLVRGDEVREFGLFLEEGQRERRVENFASAAPGEVQGAEKPRAPRPRSPSKSAAAP